MSHPLLEVENLAVTFSGEEGQVRAVDGISFRADAQRTLAIVGESGCGKSVTSLAIMGLLAPGSRAEGRILFRGDDLLAMPASTRRALRGRDIAMIFQEPMTCLNPVHRIGDQIVEGLVHRGTPRAEARQRALEMVRRVKIPAPESRMDAFPHQLSGGMRQRVMIAMVLAGDPALVIADEPTTALDVTIQAQILDLMGELREGFGMGMILITHDLGVVAETADDVVIMYAGRIVEAGPVARIFADPQHPYTLGLLASVPRLDESHDRLPTIEGSVPPPTAMPPGCRFAPRCPLADARCRTEVPPAIDFGDGHSAACWRAPLDALEAAE